MLHKRHLPIVLSLIFALAFMAPIARADDTVAVANCLLIPGSVDGNTTVPSIQADALDGGSWEPTGLLDTETGTFTFDGPAVCAGADSAGNPGSFPDALFGTYAIDADGTFVNQICGTGSANGSATLTGAGPARVNFPVVGGGVDLPPATAGNGTIDLTFAIRFTGGVGALTMVVNGGTVGGVLGTSNTVSGGIGAGFIDIIPSAGSCGSGPGVTAFLVNGSFAIILEG